MKKRLYYGRPCLRFGHAGPDGKNLRFTYTERNDHGTCVRCHLDVNGPVTDEELANQILTPKYINSTLTAEEIKKKRSEASMRWGKKNRDKQKEYQTRYYQRLKDERLQNNQPRKEDV